MNLSRYIFQQVPRKPVNQIDAFVCRIAITKLLASAVLLVLAVGGSNLLALQIRVVPTVQQSNQADNREAAAPQKNDLQKQIDSIRAQQQTAESKKKQLTQRISELQSELELIRSRGLAEPGPYSFIAFDQLQNELESNQARSESVASAVTVAAEALSSARSFKENKDASARLAKEALAANRDSAKQGELEVAAKAAELEAKLANETLKQRRLANENEQLNKQVIELTIQIQQEKRDRMAGKVRFADSDLQEILVQIERREQELRQAITLAESKQQYEDRQWSDARRKIDEQGESAVAKEELAARRAARQLAQQQLNVLNLNLARLSASREVWNRRAKVFNGGAANEELSQWALQTREAINNLNRERRVQVLGSDDVRKEIAALESRLQTLNEQTAELRPWIESQLASWREFLIANDRNLVSIDAALQWHEDLLAEIEGDIQKWTLSERLSSVWASVVDVWQMELASFDDRPITVGKVIIGILLLFIGFLAARIISRLLGNRLTRFGLNEGAVAALKSLTFYSLVVVFTLLSLRFANVPLTIFTLLGGALAIGVGFGSQAIISNFISGLIILAERPIQVGDLVKLDTLIGNVVHIGARSTRVRTGDNLDIIVPNSKFLETNVLNFTLGDDKYRTHIIVGLAYGSPTREATRLLFKSAEEHGQVLTNPKPFVWFRDFGDNSLVFELHVWIKVRTLGERLRIESDLRYRVDQLFREAGIVIAFPQRDVHLDLKQPLDIRMLSADSAHPSGEFDDAA